MRPVPRGSASWLLLGLLCATAVVPRLPLLANAERTLTSDEAVAALAMQRFLERGEIALHPWDSTYVGMVEAALALPWSGVFGSGALSVKLAAFTGHLLAMIGVFLLGRRIHGPAAGLVAAALLVVFSPQVVFWSTLAAGGILLTVAWGTACLLLAERAVTRSRCAALGFLLGLGLYVYELFLVYLVLLAPVALRALTGFPRPAAEASPTRRERALRGTLLLSGFVLGWSPKLWVLVSGQVGSKRPTYGLASPERVVENVRLLFGRCLPALLGVQPTTDPELGRATGLDAGPLAAAVAALVAAIFAVAWGAALARQWRSLRDLALLRPGRTPPEALLVLLVPVTLGLFLLSTNPVDALSNRYLLPLLTSLPILAAALVTSVARRRLVLGALLLVPLVASPTWATVRWSRAQDLLGPGLELRRQPSPLAAVLDHLERRGFEGAYATYWHAYVATFLSRERFVVAPWDDWDRFPPYTRVVDRSERVAWVFHRDEPRRRRFLARLESLDRTAEEHRVGDFVVYGAPDRRLLPPSLGGPVVRLADPRADVRVAEPPSTAPAGSVLRLPVRFLNRSDAFWSASGVGTGQLQVAAAFRWLDAADRPVVAEGERSLLPHDVRPGEELDMVMTIRVPPTLGPGRLILTLVQEDVAWFDQATGSAAVLPVEVVAHRSRADRRP